MMGLTLWRLPMSPISPRSRVWSDWLNVACGSQRGCHIRQARGYLGVPKARASGSEPRCHPRTR